MRKCCLCFAPWLHCMQLTTRQPGPQQALLFLRTRAISAPAVLMMSVGNGAFRVRATYNMMFSGGGEEGGRSGRDVFFSLRRSWFQSGTTCACLFC